MGFAVSDLPLFVVLPIALIIATQRKFDPSLLPPVMGMREGQGVHLTIDVPAILRQIREEAKQLQS